MTATLDPRRCLVASLLALGACMDPSGRDPDAFDPDAMEDGEDDDAEDTDPTAGDPEPIELGSVGLGQLTPSAIWSMEIGGKTHVSINGELFGDKLFFNYDFSTGRWWEGAPGDFDDLPWKDDAYCTAHPTDVAQCHPWKRLTAVDGMYPWGTKKGSSERLAGNISAGYTYYAQDGTGMFTFMNGDKFWVMCTTCGGSYPELLFGRLDELDAKSPQCDGTAGDADCHPWSRIRRGDGSHAWTGSGITAAFQHPDTKDFYLFNDGEYWVLRTNPAGGAFAGLYPAQTTARSVESLTGGVMSKVTDVIALPRGGDGATVIALLDGDDWQLFDGSFRATGESGTDAVNLLSCIRKGYNCGTDSDPWYDHIDMRVAVPANSGIQDVAFRGPHPQFGYGRIELEARLFYDTYAAGGKKYMRVRAMNLEGRRDLEDVSIAGRDNDDVCGSATFTTIRAAGTNGGETSRSEAFGLDLDGSLHYVLFEEPIVMEIASTGTPAQLVITASSFEEPLGCPLAGLVLVKSQ